MIAAEAAATQASPGIIPHCLWAMAANAQTPTSEKVIIPLLIKTKRYTIAAIIIIVMAQLTSVSQRLQLILAR